MGVCCGREKRYEIRDWRLEIGMGKNDNLRK